MLQFMSKDSGGPGDWGPGTKLVAAFLLVGPRKDTVIITLDDDCRWEGIGLDKTDFWGDSTWPFTI